ncbi:AzlC family ABC transporter permease [Ohessyouella blattaphilus]|uniref:AzlC family ABC transporter permease n=1 Tax=Ohessyouella blattaphilus TaxID=2949333 RepID=A0ABT1EGT7_9FIRM|nr:AzlC family ABC transporter permease [Ohessyouella blattaphilus]MCP1109925.1 AzlC family ABC transporter permease [Ohessyouella blattaphilus]MCR8563319.1 AzlC family ABC transporter permease [Ohessyouella blattaphilus]MDL2249525.1 AzlC family ABC transporter permease [Lachnospiraceae bacterium OttesenSCG-928-J05]
MSDRKRVIKKAFPYTIPVLAGYLFIGIAFGVMFAEKGYNFLWAALMSLLVYAGSGQYLAVNFFVPGYSLVQVVLLTLMVNVRHIFYGVSLLSEFNRMGKRRFYMIFSLTDETYSLLCTTKIPDDVNQDDFLFAIAVMNQLYWVIGSVIGSLAGTFLPFNSEGIDFAMTALFVVILVEQLLVKERQIPALVGIVAGFICLQVFGGNQFVFPSMVLIILILLLGKKKLNHEEVTKTCQ